MRRLARASTLGCGILLSGLVSTTAAVGQGTPPASTRSQARRMSVSWTAVPIQDVLRAFAAYSGASIVASAGVSAAVTADINDQPWDVALRTILSVHGLVATEDEYGIIRVDNIVDLNDREAIEPVITRSYRISYSRASELQAAIAPLLTSRGSVTAVQASNSLVVSDIARVQRSVAALLR
jgi:type II secretory pathway component HofQ